ncbi:CDK5 and ABL1 enzyme substrate 2-like [Sycon ciliatum]|uniref:CDK5 and ABL1 enzyme substrate 2-like n=1 Tax=Sycon ciliatum TaxID=27933 RepID=UPI0020AAC8AF|eukprot:scpid55081/ scgid15051/ CDK5 and ABL1 enzyme substrate 2; Interactor with CDK3 2
MASGKSRLQKPIGAAKKQAALSFLTGIKLDGAPTSAAPLSNKAHLSKPTGHEVTRSKPIEIVQASTSRPPLSADNHHAQQRLSYSKRSASLSESPLKRPGTASPEKQGGNRSQVSSALAFSRQGDGSKASQLPPGIQLFNERNATEANLLDARVILHGRDMLPFCMYSIKPYDPDRNRSLESSAEKYTTRVINRLTGDLASIDVPVFENFQGVVVSYQRLLDSLVLKPAACDDFVMPVHCRKFYSSNPDNEDAMTIAVLREEAINIIVDYQPHSLDDPDLRHGKHCTFMPLQSYAVSLLEYARDSAIKKAVNERFQEKFPLIQITLTKLRSLKNNMLDCSRDDRLNLDVGAVALAYVYFEKLILLGKINKTNRKYLAAVCMLLAAKFSDATREVKSIIDVLVERFKLSRKTLLAAEVPVLVSLQFTLLVPASHVLPHYQRLTNQPSIL